MIEIMEVVLMSQCGVHLWLVLFQFYWDLVVFQGTAEEFKNTIVLHSFREAKCQKSYTPGYTSITPLTERFLLSPLARKDYIFSATKDEDSELAEKAFNSQKGCLRGVKHSKKPSESSKINKNQGFIL